MDLFLLNVIGSAAVASAVLAGIIANRLSRKIAGSSHTPSDPLDEKPSRRPFSFWTW